MPEIDTLQTPTRLSLPDPDTVTNATNANQSLIRPRVLDALGEGDHQTDSVPSTGTVLPPIDDLRSAVSHLHAYLHGFGCALITKAQLQGLAAPVKITESGRVAAYIDEDLFRDVVAHVLTETQSGTDDDIEELQEAVILAHTMEFSLAMNELRVNPGKNATWPEIRGQQTETPTGIVFGTPHPITELDSRTSIPERGLAVAAGIQRLAADLETVHGQTDVGMFVLLEYMTAHGASRAHTRETIKNWYGVTDQCFAAVTDSIRDHVQDDGLPAEDPEYRYFLTEPAAVQLTTPFTQ